jgi:hypothetical protein
MRNKGAGRWVIGLLFAAGCAGATHGLQDRDWQSVSETLQARQDHGEVGVVEGFFYLRQPGVPTPLKDAPVTLIPLPPALEAVVTDARARYAGGGYQPLSTEAFAHARQPITAAVTWLRTRGRRDLTREVRTASSDEPQFRFQDVPAGRWLLLAELHSPLSTLLWAVPVTVTAGATTHQSLNDQTIWIEGLTPRPKTTGQH